MVAPHGEQGVVSLKAAELKLSLLELSLVTLAAVGMVSCERVAVG